MVLQAMTFKASQLPASIYDNFETACAAPSERNSSAVVKQYLSWDADEYRLVVGSGSLFRS